MLRKHVSSVFERTSFNEYKCCEDKDCDVDCLLELQPGHEPYCFVEFADHQSASNALAAMNKRNCMGRVSRIISHFSLCCVLLCNAERRPGVYRSPFVLTTLRRAVALIFLARSS